MNKEIEEKNAKLISDYLGSKDSKNTKQSYGYDIKIFSEFINKDLLETTVSDVVKYFELIKPLEEDEEEQSETTEKISEATYNRRLASLRDFFDFYIYSEEYTRNNPTGRTKRLTLDNEGKTEPITIEESKALIKQIKKEIKNSTNEMQKNLHIRNATMIIVNLNAGFRVSELLGLTFDRVDFEECEIELLPTRTKAKKNRTVNFDPEIIEQLKNYLEVREKILNGKESKYIFVSKNGNKLSRNDFNKILKNYGKKIGLPDLRSHQIRATYAVNTYIATKFDLVKTQMLMGHSSVLQTRKYTNIKFDEKEVVKLPTAKLKL